MSLRPPAGGGSSGGYTPGGTDVAVADGGTGASTAPAARTNLGVAPVAGGLFGPPAIVRKSADESVTSSSTLQDDNDLVFAVGANEVWTFTLSLFYSAGTTGDISWTFAVPVGATIRAGLIAADGTATSTSATEVKLRSDTAGVSGSVGGTGATDAMAHVTGSVVIGGTPGNVQFRWAQDVSNGTATIVRAGSFIVAHRIV